MVMIMFPHNIWFFIRNGEVTLLHLIADRSKIVMICDSIQLEGIGKSYINLEALMEKRQWNGIKMFSMFQN